MSWGKLTQTNAQLGFVNKRDRGPSTRSRAASTRGAHVQRDKARKKRAKMLEEITAKFGRREFTTTAAKAYFTELEAYQVCARLREMMKDETVKRIRIGHGGKPGIYKVI